MKVVTPEEASVITKKLTEIFPDKPCTGAQYYRFDDGISNDNYLIAYANGDKIAFRMAGKGSEGMVNRRDENYNTSIGAQLGITPKVIYFDERTGVKATQFIADAETLHNDTIKQHKNLDQIAAILRRLHTSKIRLHKDFNAFTEIYHYEQLLKKIDGKMYDGYDEIRPRVFALEQELNSIGVEIVSCQCDTLPENWLKDPTGKLWLLDWEYSGMNDPFWDLTAPFIEAGFSPDEEKYFLNAYFDGTVPSYAERKVHIYKILMDCLWSIWSSIKEHEGVTDLHDYGIMRLTRGIENINKL